eukprot:13378176-Ditylum_brightwellii.AAC.1
MAETGSFQTQAEPEQENGEGDLLTQPPQEEATPELEAPDTERGAEAPPQGSAVAYNMEEGVDLLEAERTQADEWLIGVYGDTLHCNDGTHLTGGVPDDLQWQQRWLKLARIPASVVLCTTPGIRSAKGIKWRIERRLDLWEEGMFDGLVDNTVAEARAREGLQNNQAQDEEHLARQFHQTVLAGKLQEAVWTATDRGTGDVLFPANLCTKTGARVLEVLEGKHPTTRVPPWRI